METQKTIQVFGAEYPKKVIPLIENAKSSIEIIAYAWKWYSDDIGCSVMQFNNAIIRRAERGVKVRVITESQEIVSKLKLNGVNVKVRPIEKTVHAKLMLIDQEITILGSHNITKNAFENNIELSIIIFDQEVNKRYKEFFENIWI